MQLIVIRNKRQAIHDVQTKNNWTQDISPSQTLVQYFDARSELTPV